MKRAIKNYTRLFISIVVITVLYFSCNTQKPLTKVRGPRELEKGAQANITWEIEAADSIHLEGIKKNLPPKGEITLKPDSSTMYTFYVYRKNERIRRKRFKIEVVEPEINSFVLPDSTTDEEPVKISWRTSNSKYVLISAISDTLRSSGRKEWQPDSSMLVKLAAYGEYNQVTENKYIKVHVIEGFEAPKKIYRGKRAKITWQFKNTEYVTITGDREKYNAGDTIFVSPAESKTYTITVHRNNGKTTDFEHHIRVASPYIKVFHAPTFVKKNENSFITWRVIGTGFAILDGDTVKAKGTKMIHVQEEQTHKLTIFDGDKPITQEIRIQILPQRSFVTKVDPEYSFQKGQRLECDIIAVDQSNYPEEVKLHVLVVDTLGNYVSKLAPPFNNEKYSAFFFKNLTENVGRRTYSKKYTVMEIRMDTTIQYDIAMSLDHSGSMYGIADSLQKASLAFIRNKYPEDRISVIKFDDQLQRMNELSASEQLILSSTNFTGLDGFGGGTALYAGTDEGIYALAGGGPDKVLLLFTDGYENASFYHFGKRAFHPNQIAQKVRDMDIKLFVISYGENINLPLLSQLAAMSGGKHYNIQRTEDIQKVFKELPRVLRHYYEITFVPKEADGEHKVRLHFNNQKGAVIKAEASIFIGDNFDLSELEFKNDLPWKKYLPSDTAKVIVAPQKVANFKFDEELIQQKYHKNLDRFFGYLTDNKNIKAIVLGHTDTKCNTEEYCEELSFNRALQVKNYLAKKGIKPGRISVKGCADNSPVWVIENTDWKAAENRRVEILLYEE